MRTIKTIIWVLTIALLLAFIYLNPDRITVHITPGANGIVAETPAWALVVATLLIGFVPTWLVGSAQRWRLARRIASLEASLSVQSHTINTHAEPIVAPDEIR